MRIPECLETQSLWAPAILCICALGFGGLDGMQVSSRSRDSLKLAFPLRWEDGRIRTCKEGISSGGGEIRALGQGHYKVK